MAIKGKGNYRAQRFMPQASEPPQILSAQIRSPNVGRSGEAISAEDARAQTPHRTAFFSYVEASLAMLSQSVDGQAPEAVALEPGQLYDPAECATLTPLSEAVTPDYLRVYSETYSQWDVRQTLPYPDQVSVVARTALIATEAAAWMAEVDENTAHADVDVARKICLRSGAMYGWWGLAPRYRPADLSPVTRPSVDGIEAFSVDRVLALGQRLTAMTYERRLHQAPSQSWFKPFWTKKRRLPVFTKPGLLGWNPTPEAHQLQMALATSALLDDGMSFGDTWRERCHQVAPVLGVPAQAALAHVLLTRDGLTRKPPLVPEVVHAGWQTYVRPARMSRKHVSQRNRVVVGFSRGINSVEAVAMGALEAACYYKPLLVDPFGKPVLHVPGYPQIPMDLMVALWGLRPSDVVLVIDKSNQDINIARFQQERRRTARSSWAEALSRVGERVYGEEGRALANAGWRVNLDVPYDVIEPGVFRGSPTQVVNVQNGVGSGRRTTKDEDNDDTEESAGLTLYVTALKLGYARRDAELIFLAFKAYHLLELRSHFHELVHSSEPLNDAIVLTQKTDDCTPLFNTRYKVSEWRRFYADGALPDHPAAAIWSQWAVLWGVNGDDLQVVIRPELLKLVLRKAVPSADAWTEAWASAAAVVDVLTKAFQKAANGDEFNQVHMRTGLGNLSNLMANTVSPDGGLTSAVTPQECSDVDLSRWVKGLSDRLWGPSGYLRSLTSPPARVLAVAEDHFDLWGIARSMVVEDRVKRVQHFLDTCLPPGMLQHASLRLNFDIPTDALDAAGWQRAGEAAQHVLVERLGGKKGRVFQNAALLRVLSDATHGFSTENTGVALESLGLDENFGFFDPVETILTMGFQPSSHVMALASVIATTGLTPVSRYDEVINE